MSAEDELNQEFERLGLDEVRARIASNHYSPVSPTRDLAKGWVFRKEQAIARDTQRAEGAFQAEQAAAASRAAAAAERAAEAAERSAEAADRQARIAEKASRIAIAALIVAIASAILSFILSRQH